MKKILLLVFCSMLMGFQAESQKATIQLTHGNFSYEYNKDRPSVWKEKKGEAVNGKFYRLILFQDIPGIHYLNALEKMGVQMLEYVPKNGYLASISTGSNLQKVFEYGAVCILPVPYELKVSKEIYFDELPSYTQIDDHHLRAILVPYRNIRIDDFLPFAQRLVKRILHVSQQDNLAEVVVHKNDVQKLTQLAGLMFVQQAEPQGEPENKFARENHRVQNVNYGRLAPVGFTGEGVVVGIGDDGAIGPHADYKGRLQQPFATASTGNHGDHVAGIVFGAGNVNPQGMGMAPGAEVFYRTYPGNLQNIVSDYNQYHVRITNSSYSDGCNTGYTNNARNMDIQTRQLPSLLHVFSAGNNGTQNCNFITGWGNITGGHKQAKNVIAVGNINSLDSINSSSSRGPAHDGRVKPEVVANGTSVFSTIDPHTYASFTGTSMSSPGTAGTLATIYHAYKTFFNQEPKSALIKAHLMNTADDLGNRGPDFRYGFGRINARRAIQAIQNNQNFSDTILANQIKTFTIELPANVAQLKVMLYYHDREALANAQKTLVNDLDMTVSHGSTIYFPLILNPAPNVAALTSAAVPGIDSVNNVEQIVIDTPAQGLYTITVTGKSIPFPAQEFFVVYDIITNNLVLSYPNGPEISWEPGSQQIIRWEAPAGTQPFQLHISADSGATWTAINTNIPAATRRLQWTLPANLSGKYWIRLTRGTQQVISAHPVHILGTPQNITINKACPDTVTLTWNAVANAQGYYITRLGQKYMEIFDTVAGQNTTIAHLTGLNFNEEEWLSVMAYGANGLIGNRGVAARKAPGLFNCTVQKDLALEDVFNFPNGAIPSCQASDSIRPVLRIRNVSTDQIASAVASVFANGSLLISDTITAGLPSSGNMINYTFTKQFLMPNQPLITFKVVIKGSGDQNAINDTLTFVSGVYNASSVTIPFTTNFDSNPLCSDSADCEQTVCSIASWANLQNGIQDNIDWRVHTGPTQTAGTGPSGDYNLNGQGRYIYLEATSCSNQTANLASNCFTVSGLTLPELSFWYHMFGPAMGQLEVQILDSNRWTTVWQRSGNQGNAWLNARISLLPYIGKKIAVRFVGTTGGNTSDLALDLIEIRQNTLPPIPDFAPSVSVTCPQAPVTLFDLSMGTPTQWQWSITPNTFTLVGGSTLNSQNPVVSFNQIGTYTVKLVASNANGSDSITKVNVINITAGQNLPFSQNFQPQIFPPANWEVVNPDNGITWNRQSPTPHSTGNASARMNFFNYTVVGEVDYLNLPLISLLNTTQPALLFDVAYAQYPGFSDSLAVEAVGGCVSNAFTEVYKRGGSQLATANPSTNQFTPTQSQWRTDTILLTPFANGPVRLRFKSINGYGNNLYITNVRIVDLAQAPPVAAFTVQLPQVGVICVGDTVTFVDNSQNNPASYNWTFGNGASPAFANTPGPHKVVYLNGGQKTVTLSVLNANGTSSATQTLNVFENPTFSPSIVVNLDTLTFSANVVGSYDSLRWNFGDGTTSTLPSGTHKYQVGGTYSVTLIVYHACGTLQTSAQVTVSGFSVAELEEVGFNLYPNPSRGEFSLQLHSALIARSMRITDVTGRVVHEQTLDNRQKIDFSLKHLPSGSYVVTVEDLSGQVKRRQLIISK
ncbi:MAG: S8 family serine peptidase [Thermaurantimonas sp.]|uniref:S8 family serine peptidase n=1 Tax=Thermaurantimonas sp. TaxID=2681568 RepID=UPI00391C7D0F